MDPQIFTTITPEELKALVKTGLREVLTEAQNKEQSKAKNYSLNQAAQILNRHHTTIKKLIVAGKLQAIEGGRRITEAALNEYLRETT